MSGPRGRELWDASFSEQIEEAAYNTAPVEALVRTVSYHLRHRYSPTKLDNITFLEIGCGGGANLGWLATRGIRVAGLDISPRALELARRSLARVRARLLGLVEASAASVPFADASFDGVIEACVVQHLDRPDREAAFREVHRVLRPGGAFVGYMLADQHSIYVDRRAEEPAEDPGTLVLRDGRSPYYLSDLGVSHFFGRAELERLLQKFTEVDVLETTYNIPSSEARRRGYDAYRQSMWTVYAVK